MNRNEPTFLDWDRLLRRLHLVASSGGDEAPSRGRGERAAVQRARGGAAGRQRGSRAARGGGSGRGHGHCDGLHWRARAEVGGERDAAADGTTTETVESVGRRWR